MDHDADRAIRWTDVVERLRSVLRRTELVEERKWGKPCFTDGGKNIVIVQEMKEFVALMFFKGVLLPDPAGVLEDQGPNSRSARRITFTSTADVDRLADVVVDYVARAVESERAGLEVPDAGELTLVDELRDRLDRDPELRAAFEALTPGRRREYHLHVASAKRSDTRRSRVERCVPGILAGKGLRDR